MDPLLWVVLVSAALSGFFGLTGFALRAHRRVQLEEAFSGRSGGKRLESLERHLPALRLSASFCRSLANIALLVSMLYLLGGPGHGWASALAAIAITGAIIAIFGVAIPHAWSAYAGEKVLAAVFPVLIAVRYALYPVIAVMQAFDSPIRRLSGAENNHHENGDNARQEILQAASEGRAEGAVDAEEVRMIASVIEFGETCAGEIMTPRTDIFALPVDLPWHQAAARIVEAGHTRVPVYQGYLDNIIGILYAKDLLGHLDDPGPVDLRKIMRKPFFVPETKALDDLLREFKARKVHMAVVLDEYGGTAGLVTIEDVLEEIVGDISDEYDHASPALMHRVDKATAEVDGRMHIDDLNDAMGLRVPEEEDYDTVAGFVFSKLGYIPKVGDKLDSHGATFTVLAADDRKITRLHVKLAEKRHGEEF